MSYANGVTLDFSRPGKPTDNAFIEAFNGRLRAECLNAHWFMSLEDAQEKIRGLAQVLQRATPAWGNRAENSDIIGPSR
jgi:putative transposase